MTSVLRGVKKRTTGSWLILDEPASQPVFICSDVLTWSKGDCQRIYQAGKACPAAQQRET